jgi:hypothetical protein
VSGGIFEDSVWTLAQSPYIVTGNVTLFPGYTLTIEPGVQVRFEDDTSLTIRGALVAEGTKAKRILFTSNHPAPARSSWRGVVISTNLGGMASIAFADFEYAHSALMLMESWWRVGGSTCHWWSESSRRNSSSSPETFVVEGDDLSSQRF